MKNSSAEGPGSQGPFKERLSSEPGLPSAQPLSRSPQEVLAELSSPRLFFRGDRFTCTFLLDREVTSIHFDGTRSEIFLNGHGLRNMNLDENHRVELKAVVQRLKEAGADQELIRRYEASLLKFF